MAVPLRPKRGRPIGSRSFDPRSAEAFGQIVRSAREELGTSQEALAAAAEIERSHFSRIERGLSQPTLFAMLKIAAALGVPAAALVEHVESEMRRRGKRK
jgi:XRE family transcriptional regulator, regulator of sulfur utilization